MKYYRIKNVAAAIITGCLVMSTNSFADMLEVAVVDHQEIVKVETIDTTLAHPAKIKITKLKDALEVAGAIKRKRHNNQTIRGHVDIDLISVNGEILESKFLPMKNFIGSAKHDHERKFATKFALPKSSNYQVKVRHHIYMDGHK